MERGIDASRVETGADGDTDALGKRCVTLTSDQRIHVPTTGLYTYADLLVACGERSYKPDRPPSLLNPTIVVEVTFDSTEDYDRGKKFLNYQSVTELPSRTSHRSLPAKRAWRVDPRDSHRARRSREPYGLEGAFTVNDVYDGVDLAEGD